MKRTEGIDCCVRIAGLSRRIPNDIETEVFRIVQESLRNIQKHSEATCATVTVKFYKRKLALTVCDNGKGFNVPKTLVSLVNRGSLGLIGIQERVHLLNGKLSVNSIVGRGSTISIAIPLQLD
jgi:signal transduction histidine kinase